jgi:hypothetical protein
MNESINQSFNHSTKRIYSNLTVYCTGCILSEHLNRLANTVKHVSAPAFKERLYATMFLRTVTELRDCSGSGIGLNYYI